MKEKISQLFVGRRKWLTIPVFVFLVGLIAVTLLALIFVDAPDDDEPIQLSYELSSDNAPDLVTGNIADALNKKYLPEDVSPYLGNTAPYWHAANDNKLYVSYTDNDASSLDIDFEDSDLLNSSEVTKQRNDIITTITSSLGSQGFKKITDSAYGQLTDVWYKDGIICTIDTTTSSQFSSPLSLRCGSLYWYDTDLDEYRNAAVFSKVYKTATGKAIKDGDVFVLDSTTNSVVDGYSKAEVTYSNVGQGSPVGLLFYQKGDGQWHYFTTVQSDLSCAAYNTTDLRAAFKGDTCYDQTKNKDSTVQ